MACAEQHSCFESGPPIEIVLYAIYLYLSDPEPKTNSKNTSINRREKKP